MLKLLLGGASGIWGYIAAAGAALVAILAVLAKAKQSGRDEVITAQAKKEVENVKTAQKVEREVAVAPPVDVHKRLRDKYSRD
jgi:hypothetical protein